jgi:hypothetical protein
MPLLDFSQLQPAIAKGEFNAKFQTAAQPDLALAS